MLKLKNVLIINKIVKFIKSHGADFGNWYIGITMDPSKRLQIGHNVSFEYDTFILLSTDSCDDARFIEKYIIDTYKTKGGPGGAGAGEEETEYIYAYKTTKMTKEATFKKTLMKILVESIEDEQLKKVIEEMGE